ncbi:MAG: hypothetical protein IIA35_03540 [Proteobacteria bacterium]|nr:hypothetical protein [Pseudomonadota bacterium]
MSRIPLLIFDQRPPLDIAWPQETQIGVLSSFQDSHFGHVAIDWADEIVKGMLITRDGEVVHPAFTA